MAQLSVLTTQMIMGCLLACATSPQVNTNLARCVIFTTGIIMSIMAKFQKQLKPITSLATSMNIK